MRVLASSLVPVLAVALTAVGGAGASKCHPRPTVLPSASSSSTSTGLGSSASSSPPSSVSSTSSSFSSSTTTSSVTTTTSTIASSSSSSVATFNPSGYSYYEVSLPVVFDGTAASKLPATSTYTLEPATRTGTPTCVIDPASATTATFQILDNAGHRFIPKDSGIGALVDADFPSGSDDAANQAFSEASVFRLEAGHNGRYHLTTRVVSGGQDVKMYVAYVDEGLPGRASIQTVRVDANLESFGISTSMFGFTCDGRLVVTSRSGGALTWTAAEDGTITTLTPGEPGAPEQTIFLVPVRQSPSSVPTTSKHKRTRFGGMMDLNRRMSPYTDGKFPRLPSTPADMTAKPRPGARTMGGSGSGNCGTGSTSAAGSMILFNDFNRCCVQHDYCFDNCATGPEALCSSDDKFCQPGQFERCNDGLAECMLDTVCAGIPWATQPSQRQRCELEASFMQAAVGTDIGGESFDQATRDRCGGYCPGGRPFCGGGGGSTGSCVSATDTDNCEECGQSCNAALGFTCSASKCTCSADLLSDDANCGACGYRCPSGTRCDGAGRCVCAAGQCGQLCLDFRTHPRNCGACGVACESGYCSGGVCVDPAAVAPSPTGPDGCLATDAVKNGGFEITSGTSASPWTVSGLTNASVAFARRITGNVVAKFSFTAATGTATVTQRITLCRSAEYAVSYSTATSGTGSLRVKLRATDGSGAERLFMAADWTGVRDSSDSNDMSTVRPQSLRVPEEWVGNDPSAPTVTVDLVFDVSARVPGFSMPTPVMAQLLLDEVTIYQP
ncbi:hypothetical protein MN608_11363 [Microdochium nivale]|nr:hypothetical protein MN608_11363 [Microdochium nivale]